MILLGMDFGRSAVDADVMNRPYLFAALSGKHPSLSLEHWGTAFLFSAGGKLFVVTAKHVVDSIRNTGDGMVLMNGWAQFGLGHLEWKSVKVDERCADLAFAMLPAEEGQAIAKAVPPLMAKDVALKFNAEAPCVAVGYPCNVEIKLSASSRPKVCKLINVSPDMKHPGVADVICVSSKVYARLHGRYVNRKIMIDDVFRGFGPLNGMSGGVLLSIDGRVQGVLLEQIASKGTVCSVKFNVALKAIWHEHSNLRMCREMLRNGDFLENLNDYVKSL